MYRLYAEGLLVGEYPDVEAVRRVCENRLRNEEEREEYGVELIKDGEVWRISVNPSVCFGEPYKVEAA